ncbi:XamI family restriction endonuclease [Polaromonas glacialis]|uniref:XamI family restriction endonuclease n=1 Tax=Polaromonas glacialis TaxID=866564 RepID=UPI000AB48798|nr:XamI family restriction endonuclease [Polaromonas glacialis]
MYNDWFMNFAPSAFRSTRIQTTKDVEAALYATGNLTDIKPAMLRARPEILPTLRMSTCPPLAVDRLIGLAGVSSSLVKRMELHQKLPVRMKAAQVDVELAKITAIIEKLADPDIFVWLGREAAATQVEIHRSATIVADRLCGAVANPIIRNAQEKRQLQEIKNWLEAHGYTQLPSGAGTKFDAMPPGTFSFRMNVPVKLNVNVNVNAMPVTVDDEEPQLIEVEEEELVVEVKGNKLTINIPIDAVIMPKSAKPGDFPLFFEAKSAGDFTNTNKRRKEEAKKVAQLHSTYGSAVRFNLFLCGYFDSGYLGYEAADGIDWVWEHRIDDFALFGL